MTIFGSIIPDDVVEDAVVVTLEKWVPTYMSEVERQLGMDPSFYERPGSGAYTVRADFDKFPEEMLPLVVVVCPGITDDPPKRGPDKTYSAKFQINTTCITSSIDRTATRQYASRLGAALRAALIQHQSLDQQIGGRVRGIEWIAERNKELPPEDDRTIWANRQVFFIEVDDVLSRRGGPVNPEPLPDPTTPHPPDPTVLTADVTIEKEPITP